MKKGIHPNYREVVFLDTSNEFRFVSRSTIDTRDTIDIDGKTYPLVKLEVTSESHPFYTGKKIFLDTAGRVEKFNKRFAKKEVKNA
jgi:large subunit ribosomal protein L31